MLLIVKSNVTHELYYQSYRILYIKSQNGCLCPPLLDYFMIPRKKNLSGELANLDIIRVEYILGI
jgi:hypothetical protein